MHTNITNSPSSEAETVDELQALIDLWANEWTQRHHTELNWVDYTGNKLASKTSRFRSHHLNPAKYKLELKCDALVKQDFKEPVSAEHLIETDISQFERNESDLVSELSFSRIIERTVQKRIAVTWSATFGVSLTLTVAVPPFTAITANTSLQINRTKTSETTEGDKKSWTINKKIPCEPKKITKVTAIVTEKHTKASFQKKVSLSGYVVIACKDKIAFTSKEQKGEHRKWPVPIAEVFADLQHYAKDDQTSKSTRKTIKKQLKKFEVAKERISFVLQGEVEVQEGISCDTISSPISLNQITYEPEKIRTKLIDVYKKQLRIERLFFESLPLEQSYVNLSLLSALNYQQQLNHVIRNASQYKLSYDESQDAITHLYGQGNSYTLSVANMVRQFSTDTNNKVLITGTAGIGKSVLSQYLLHAWANKSCGQQYQWVFRIPLRNLLEEKNYPEKKQQDYRLIDILKQECLGQKALALTDVLKDSDLLAFEQEINIKKGNDQVLFVLDGYDEIAEQLPKYLEKVLTNLLASPHVVLTSRPYNLHGLETYYGFRKTLHFEVTGFTDNNIKDYITNFFKYLSTPKPEKADALLNFLEQNPKVKGACRIPINIELVCSAWHEQNFTDQVTSTYELYHEVMISLCMRLLQKQGKNITNLDDSEVVDQFKPPLAFLDFIAYHSMAENQLFFNVTKAKEYIIAVNRLNKENGPQLLQEQKALGIIKPNNTDGKYDGKSLYYFNHLTFRDFFAARYIAYCLQQAGQTETVIPVLLMSLHHWQNLGNFSLGTVEAFISHHKFEASFELVAWFIAGHLAKIEDLATLKYFFKILFAKPKDITGYYELLLLIRCLDESYKTVKKFSSPLRQSLFKPITDWLQILFTTSTIPTQQLVEKSAPLLQRLKLSQTLLQSDELQSYLKTAIQRADENSLMNIANFLSTLDMLTEESFDLIIKQALSLKEINKNYVFLTSQDFIQQVAKNKVLLNKLLELIKKPLVFVMVENLFMRVMLTVFTSKNLLQQPLIQSGLKSTLNLIKDKDASLELRQAAVNGLSTILSSVISLTAEVMPSVTSSSSVLSDIKESLRQPLLQSGVESILALIKDKNTASKIRSAAVNALSTVLSTAFSNRLSFVDQKKLLKQPVMQSGLESIQTLMEDKNTASELRNTAVNSLSTVLSSVCSKELLQQPQVQSGLESIQTLMEDKDTASELRNTAVNALSTILSRVCSKELLQQPQVQSGLESIQTLIKDKDIASELRNAAVNALSTVLSSVFSRVVFSQVLFDDVSSFLTDRNELLQQPQVQSGLESIQTLIKDKDTASELRHAAVNALSTVLLSVLSHTDRKIFDEYSSLKSLIESVKAAFNDLKLPVKWNVSFKLLHIGIYDSAIIDTLLSQGTKEIQGENEIKYMLKLERINLTTELSLLSINKPVNCHLLSDLLENVSTTNLLNYIISSKNSLERQNMWAVVVPRFIQEGKPIYIHDHNLYYYKDRKYEPIPLNSLNEEVVRNDLREGFKKLTGNNLPLIDAKIFAEPNDKKSNEKNEIENLKAENKELKQQLAEVLKTLESFKKLLPPSSYYPETSEAQLLNIQRERGSIFTNKKLHTFEFNDPNIHANTIYVVGSFNNWKQNPEWKMQKDESRIWKLSKHLEVGKHEYKFLIDGHHWYPAGTNNNLIVAIEKQQAESIQSEIISDNNSASPEPTSSKSFKRYSMEQ